MARQVRFGSPACCRTCSNASENRRKDERPKQAKTAGYFNREIAQNTAVIAHTAIVTKIVYTIWRIFAKRPKAAKAGHYFKPPKLTPKSRDEPRIDTISGVLVYGCSRE